MKAWPLRNLLAFSLIRLHRVPCTSDTQKYPQPSSPRCIFNLLCLRVIYSDIPPPPSCFSTWSNPAHWQDPVPTSCLPRLVLRNLNLEEGLGLQVTESLIRSGSNNKRFVFLLKEINAEVIPYLIQCSMGHKRCGFLPTSCSAIFSVAFVSKFVQQPFPRKPWVELFIKSSCLGEYISQSFPE